MGSRTRLQPRTFQRLATDRAWFGTLMATSIITVAEAAYALIDYYMLERMLLPVIRLGHLGGTGALTVLLWRHRDKIRMETLQLIFLVAALPLLPISAAAELSMVETGLSWAPFSGHKLMLIGSAMLAPGRKWLGTSLIAAVTLEVLVLWAVFEGMAVGAFPWEPWTTLVFAGVSWALLINRRRSERVEQHLLEIQSEARALEQLAKSFLALRDAASTPLQTLEIGLEILKEQCPQAHAVTLIERSVARLRVLNGRLSSADPLLAWGDEDASFDAEHVLRELEDSLREEAERRREAPPPS